jgi:hypothetical protein
MPHMSRRFLALALLGLAPLARAADPVSVQIRQFGLGGSYSKQADATWVQVELRNNPGRPILLELVVTEPDLGREAEPLTGTFTLPVQLSPGESRVLDLPIPISEGGLPVVFVDVRDANGVSVGRDARLIGKPTVDRLIALLCTTPELCRSIHQTILLSGSAEEQARKARNNRLVPLTEPPPAWWAYPPGSTVILAEPLARLSPVQRDALELFLRRGATVVLLEDQLADSSSTAGGSTRFLAPYREKPPDAKLHSVGSGSLIRFSSASSADFALYFRALGFSEYVPPEIRRQAERFSSGEFSWNTGITPQSWAFDRLATSFRFPSFLELLLWILGYLLLAGLLNFLLLRRLGRPDWAWITIPAFAILFSVVLYVSSARNRPREFRLDQLAVFEMDNLSPLAVSSFSLRISAPERSAVHPVVSGEVIRVPDPRNNYVGDHNLQNLADLEVRDPKTHLAPEWDTSLLLRMWSYRDLFFEGFRRFPGTLRRDSSGVLHNDTGLSFQKALLVNKESVYVLGPLRAGASADLSHAQRQPYQQEVGRRIESRRSYPGPPFRIRSRRQQDGNLSATELQRFDGEWRELSRQPFSLLELIRGWPSEFDDVFSDTKAIFFGFSEEPPTAELRGISAARKSYSLTIVTFQDWP